MKGTISASIIALAFITSIFVAMVSGTDPGQGIALYGSLMDKNNGNEITGTVTFVSADGTTYTATTYAQSENAMGGFTIYLPEGAYKYQAEARGYQSASGSVKVSGEQVRLLIEMEPIQTTDNGVVIGRVVTPEGRGIPGALVVITEISEISSRPPAVYKAQTGDEGKFDVKLPYAGYVAEAEARGYQAGRAEFKLTAENPRAEVKIVLGPISTNDTEVGIVHGIVMTENNRGIPGALVVITPLRTVSDKGPERIKTQTDENGKFSIRLPYGAYSARSEARGFQAGEAEFKLNKEQPETRVQIILLPLDEKPEVGIVHGYVFTGKERGIPGALVTITPVTIPRPMNGEMKMDPSTGMYPDMWIEPYTTTTDESGKFSLRLPYGAYYALAEAKGFNPGKAEFKITSEVPETRLVIALEPIKEREGKEGRTVSFKMVDRDSDGNPEYVHLLVEMNGMAPPEVLIDITDKDSDGNPENTVFEINVEPRLQKMVFALIQMYLMNNCDGIPVPGIDGQIDPSTGCGEGCYDQNGVSVDGVRERIKDLIDDYTNSQDDGSADGTTDPDQSEDVDKDQDTSGNDDPIAPKGSDGGSETMDLLMGIGVITMVLGVLAIVAFMSLRRNGS
jgi:hypothetical protein